MGDPIDVTTPLPSDREPTRAVERGEPMAAAPPGPSHSEAGRVSSSIGPYVLLAVLGQGGFGVVHRARHRETGREVALKTVTAARVSVLKGIRREVQALARIDHPGIVRILDHGDDELGLPWYAMEIEEGSSLRRWVPLEETATGVQEGVSVSATRAVGDSWWTQSVSGATPSGKTIPAPPPVVASGLLERLTLARRLCVPLAYLHGEGIVHRDLKPDNVLVRRDGTPVLVDFGLAQEHGSDVSRDVLEVTSDASGTIAYMAPEQGQGRVVDARADLYALGCILYELLTGRQPFRAESPAELLWSHMKVEPVPPSRFVSDLPAPLDQLVLRLLAKDPRHRVGFAQDVASALAALGAQNGCFSSAPRPRPYLYRADLAGREQSFEALSRKLDGLAMGGGGIVLVSGESGVGKTRLLTELATEARRAKIEVFGGECLSLGADAATGGAVALQALKKPLQAIGDRCQALGSAYTFRLLGSAAPILVAYAPRLARLPGLEAIAPPVAVSPEAARRRLYATLTDLLLDLAAQGPHLLVIDDLQWADELTLGLLQALADRRALTGSHLLVIGTCRADEVTPGIECLMGSSVETLDLSRLDRSALGEIVSDMLALSPAPPDLVDHVARESEGNPLFLAEYLRAAVTEGFLARDSGGRWCLGSDRCLDRDVLPLPRSLQDLLTRRLQSLSPDAREVLDLSSVLGREVDPELLFEAAALGGIGSAKVESAISELASMKLVEETDHGPLRITHDKIREVSYRSLSEQRRRSLHGGAAQALDGWARGRREEHLAALGHHLERAGERLRAADCYADAARYALGQHALEEAERLLRAFLRLQESPSPRGVGVRSTLASRVLFLAGKSEAARAEYERAIEEARAIQDRAGEAQCLDGLGIVHQDCGRVAEAEKLYRAAAEIHRELGDRKAEGNSLANLAAIPSQMGRIAESEELYRQALAVQVETGDRLGQGMTAANLAELALKRGALAEARTLTERGLAIYREVGHRRFEGLSLGQMGDVCIREKDLAAARSYYEAAIAVMKEVGDRRWEGLTLAKIALLALEEGRNDEVVPLLERSIAILREVGDRWSEGNVIEELGAALGRLGRLDEALARYHEAMAIHEELANRRGIEAVGRALASLDLGSPEEGT